MENYLMTSIGELKGVGEKTEPLFHKLGIISIKDLIYYFPRTYTYYVNPIHPMDYKPSEPCAIRVTIIKRPLCKRTGRLQIVTTTAVWDGIPVSCIWFHMPYLAKTLSEGKSYILYGILEANQDKYKMEMPVVFSECDYEKIEGTLQPVYSLTKGLSNNLIKKCVSSAFRLLGDNSDNHLDEIKLMHFPPNFEMLKAARDKLVYDEFLAFILRMRMLKGERSQNINDFAMIPVAQTNRIIDALPYRLTNAQLRVWKEISEEMCSEYSMTRLVQGDVGSGKTIIAVLAAVMTAENGYQAAIMAPTEILAQQHFKFISELLKQHDFHFQCELLTGSVTASQKKSIKERLLNDEIRIIVGTHALLTDNVVFHNLGLVVTDEQHRFGVHQREILQNKGHNTPHVLVMSATPIPRTMAVIIYGDLDISVIDELPAHKKSIKNCVVDTSYRSKAYSFMLKEIEAGHQVYIICPLATESEGVLATDVISYSEKLRNVFPESVQIGVLHGKMKPSVKNQIMSDFAAGNIHILVSTTVVEVGINVPNATVMMVEDANRFGLAQLHQLRGRIGRGEAQSYCIFMSSSHNETTKKRLEILCNSNDGFYIASEDMKMRGPGDLLGYRQSGDMQFMLGDIYMDADILKKASEDADIILSQDPQLSEENHKKYRNMIAAFANKDIIL